MKIGIAKYYLSRKRILHAMVAALFVHLFLFSGGYLIIDRFVKPDNSSRSLVINLDNSASDGIEEATSEESNTVNDARTGKPKDIVQQAKPEEAAATPAHEPDQNPQLDYEPRPALDEQLAHSQNEQIKNQDPTNSKPSSIESPPTLDERVSTPIQTTAGQNEVTNQEDLSILVGSDSDVITTESSTAPSSQVDELPSFSLTQQKMLDKRIRNWAENMESITASSESISWKHQGQSYVANFNRLPAIGDMGMDEIVVEVVTQQNGNELSKELRMKKLAFSNFAQFTHYWDTNIRVHNDEMNGRFHSNSTILLDADRQAAPVFHGKVTTASHRVDIYRNGSRKARNKIFKGGLETRVKKIRMPQPRILLSNQSSNSRNSIVFDKDTNIQFRADGRILWNHVGDLNLQEIFLDDTPIYLFARRGKTLFVSGTVNGKILIYSPTKIVINGDLRYADRQSTGPEADILGLVSGRDIVVAEPKVTGPGDLAIDASIYAKGRFRIKRYRADYSGVLRIFGSLSAGTVSATEPRFATSIVFDRRLENTRPPGFPLTDRYELAMSEPGWTATPLPTNPTLSDNPDSKENKVY